MIKHGHTINQTPSPTFNTWSAMMQRCYNKNTYGFKFYGLLGIEVDPWWHSFSNFLADMGEKPEKCSIERLNSKRNYWKGNCVWLVADQQQKNRSNSRMITYHLRTMCISDWEKELGFKPNTLRRRLDLGWSVEKAMTQPLRGEPR